MSVYNDLVYFYEDSVVLLGIFCFAKHIATRLPGNLDKEFPLALQAVACTNVLWSL